MRLGVGGVGRRERLGHGGGTTAPEPGVEPDVRIEEAAADGDQIGLGKRVAHQHHGAAPAKPLQQIGELALEVESAGHHEVGPSEPVGIPWRWLVGVGIDAGGHQAIDGHPVSPHLTHEIGHHGCGGHHPQRATVRCP